jgi:ankyrin repeat protein
MRQLLITIAAVVLVGCVTNMSIYEASEKGNIRAVKQHLASGKDVNAKDSEGKTPLDYALNKPSEIVDFLLKHGGKTGEELKAEGK